MSICAHRKALEVGLLYSALSGSGANGSKGRHQYSYQLERNCTKQLLVESSHFLDLVCRVI